MIVPFAGRIRRALVAPLVLAFALGGGLAVSGPGAAEAQGGLEAQRAIDVTQSVIDRASSTINCAPGDGRLACTYLAQAVSLQQSARGSYGGGFYRDAIALTLRARDRAYSALRTGQDATGGEFVRLSIERTDALIERVSVAVRESGSEPARRQLDVAADLQRRARALAGAGRPRAALSATTQARDHALRAQRLADGSAAQSPDKARIVLERTDELLRASAWLADAPRARAAFEQARSTEERAWSRLRAGDVRRAVTLSLSAREQLGRALERADDDAGSRR